MKAFKEPGINLSHSKLNFDGGGLVICTDKHSTDSGGIIDLNVRIGLLICVTQQESGQTPLYRNMQHMQCLHHGGGIGLLHAVI